MLNAVVGDVGVNITSYFLNTFSNSSNIKVLTFSAFYNMRHSNLSLIHMFLKIILLFTSFPNPSVLEFLYISFKEFAFFALYPNLIPSNLPKFELASAHAIM